MNTVAKKTALSFCVLGNIMLDIVTSLPHVKHTEVARFATLRNLIRIIPGGTAVNIALAASNQGFSPVSVIGKIGVSGDHASPDIAGQLITETLEREKIHLCLAHDGLHATGVTMITYFDQDARLLVADRGANDSFGLDDITSELLAVIARSDILFVSGYMLMSPNQAQATVRVMEHAKRLGKLIALDVVPHSIHKLVAPPVFLEYTKSVNMLIAELATLRHLFPEIETCNPETQIDEIARNLLKYYGIVLIRPTNLIQHLYDRRGLVTSGNTGYKADDPESQRGYLDVLAVQTIDQYYDRFTRNLTV